MLLVRISLLGRLWYGLKNQWSGERVDAGCQHLDEDEGEEASGYCHGWSHHGSAQAGESAASVVLEVIRTANQGEHKTSGQKNQHQDLELRGADRPLVISGTHRNTSSKKDEALDARLSFRQPLSAEGLW